MTSEYYYTIILQFHEINSLYYYKVPSWYINN